jgi:hypothetical protein
MKGNFSDKMQIDNAAAMVWVVWLLWRQWTALQKARSPKGGSELDNPEGSDEKSNFSQSSNKELGVLQQDDLLRQDSMTQLVAPSAVHVHNSNKKG